MDDPTHTSLVPEKQETSLCASKSREAEVVCYIIKNFYSRLLVLTSNKKSLFWLFTIKKTEDEDVNDTVTSRVVICENG